MPFLPFIPFVNCIDIVIQLTQQAVPWQLTFLAASSVTVDNAQLAAVSGAIDGWITSDLAAQISGNCSFDNIKLTDLTTQFGPTHNAIPTTTAGTLSGTVIPAQAAMVVSLYTNNRGRSFRGRSYLAGRVTGDQQTVTHWTTTRASAVDTAYFNLITALSAVNCTLSVGSRQENGVRRTVGVATPVTQIVAKTPIATQRRRLL